MDLTDPVSATYQVLLKATEPLGWARLLEGLRALAPALVADERLQQKLYAAVDYHAKSRGPRALVVKVGRGVFAANKDLDPETVVQYVSPLGVKQRRVVGSLEERRCGNCRYLSYEGIEQVRLAHGLCDQHPKVERLGHDSREDASECPYWGPRPDSQRRQDLLLRDAIFAEVAKNAGRRR